MDNEHASIFYSMNKLTILPFLTVLVVSCDPEMHKFPHESATGAPTKVVQATPTPSTDSAPAPVEPAPAEDAAEPTPPEPTLAATHIKIRPISARPRRIGAAAPAPSVAQTATRPTAPAPIRRADPTAAFLTPKQDKNLPSDKQLAEGAASSIGTGNAGAVSPSNQPSTAIKPPTTAPSKEDDLAPGE